MRGENTPVERMRSKGKGTKRGGDVMRAAMPSERKRTPFHHSLADDSPRARTSHGQGKKTATDLPRGAGKRSRGKAFLLISAGKRKEKMPPPCRSIEDETLQRPLPPGRTYTRGRGAQGETPPGLEESKEKFPVRSPISTLSRSGPKEEDKTKKARIDEQTGRKREEITAVWNSTKDSEKKGKSARGILGSGTEKEKAYFLLWRAKGGGGSNPNPPPMPSPLQNSALVVWQLHGGGRGGGEKEMSQGPRGGANIPKGE